MNKFKNIDKLNTTRRDQLLSFFDKYDEGFSATGTTEELAINTVNLIGADIFMTLLHEKGYLLQLDRDWPAEKFVEDNFDSIVDFAKHVMENVTGDDNLAEFFTKNWETRHYLSTKLYEQVLGNTADKETRSLFDRAVTLTLINNFMSFVTHSIIEDYASSH